MTVKELIAQLQEAPQDAKVFTSTYFDSGCDTCGGWDTDVKIIEVSWLEGTNKVDLIHEEADW